MNSAVLRWIGCAGLAVSLLATTTACGNSDPFGDSPADTDPNHIVIGSANFPESETVADIYAKALAANGFQISTKLNIGSREAYVPAVQEGSISLIPDYTGNLLRYLDKSATATAPDEVNRDLQKALGSDLTIATPAPGEDKDAVVVTRETANTWQLTSIADLAPHSAEVKFGAPAEFRERPVGLPGLKRNYDLDIAPENFVPIGDGGGPATVQALASGQVTAADIFTTSPAIKKNDFVVLADPKNNFPAQNVVPLINAKKRTDKLIKVLDAVSARLTTDELVALNEAVSGETKTDPQAAADAWVAARGLDKPVG
ncbi:ABC transporter substrate-binding protein [Skermania piniformis]|uniref:ABC transporter substrate-binding protein n=1 Tax=Skermania pinensis TaxID=39122 RepID=A0ABX8SCF0_9ACTN|nr:ABC transporter substrate-binding protein [Skermania piniformis]QXQ14659.1 ABC transporter substrate-binding protein [Skermania piniformis]